MPAVTAGSGLTSPSLRVVVTVGTDHHPFNRLIGWTNDWLRLHPEQVPGFFVQSGAVSVIPACPSSQFLDVERMSKVLDEADVIVCHGGPESIAAAWARGLLPIVVPRLPQLGEHVDDHQVHFCLKLAELGRVWLAQTPAEFASNLAEATRDHSRLRACMPAADVHATVARFGQLVEELVRRSHRRPPRRRRRWRVPATPKPNHSPAAMNANMPLALIPESSTRWNAQDGQTSADVRELADEEQ
jgi:UDP-N-acetylglucosamine transferase subunit ALG13